MKSLNLKAGLVSLLIFLAFLGIWYTATLPSPGTPVASTAGLSAEQIEYQKMMGKDPGSTKTTGFPTLGQMGAALRKDRKSAVWGQSVSVRVDQGGRRDIK